MECFGMKICDILPILTNALLYDPGREKDVQRSALQLKMLSKKQFQIASGVLANLMKAFSSET